MTFANFDEEMVEVWNRGIEVILAKVYDKVSNLLDGTWMKEERKAQYKAYTLKLADMVEAEYGTLNIVKIARAICA